MGYKKRLYNKKYYDFIDKYNKNIKSKKFSNLLSGVNLRNKKILDIGCGSGEALKYCLDNYAALVYGVDFSKDAISLSRNFCGNKINLKLFCMDAKNMNFKTKFDIIFLFDVIEHIPAYEIKLTYSKIFKFLKPNGLLIIKTPFFNSIEEYQNTWNLCKYDKTVHINIQSKKSLWMDLKKAGFIKYNQNYFGKEPKRFCYYISALNYFVLTQLNIWLRRITKPKRTFHFLLLKLKWNLKSMILLIDLFCKKPINLFKNIYRRFNEEGNY